MHTCLYVVKSVVSLFTGTTFTDNEIVGIAIVKALSGGPLIISDNLAQVPTSRLRVIQQIIPPIGIAATPIDILDREMPEILRLPMSGWVLMGVCNWEVSSSLSCVYVCIPYCMCTITTTIISLFSS